MSVLLIPIGVATNSITPRLLGPIAYGNFSFLNGSFAQLLEFFEAGFSSAYYVKLSRDQSNFRLVKFFLMIRIILSFGVILITALILLGGWGGVVWPGQNKIYILMALFLSILTIYQNTTTSTMDALGLTVKIEKVKLFQKLIGLILIISLFYFNISGLDKFYAYNYVLAAILLYGGYKLLVSYFNINERSITFTKSDFFKYLSNFWEYSHPLILLAIIGAVTSLFDIWILQYYGGPTQQGYYMISYKIASLTFLFTKAMSPLITREFSLEHSKNNIEQVRFLFTTYFPLFFLLTLFFSSYLFVEAENVTHLFAGDKFKGASTTIALMSLYPIHQTFGQLSGAFFYATGQTRLFRNIAVLSKLGGMILTSFLVSPFFGYGLSLGSTGLVIKMLVYQTIFVNILLYYNTAFLSLRFGSILFRQFGAIVLFLAAAKTSKQIVSWLIGDGFVALASGFILYSIACTALIYCFPKIAWLTKPQLLTYINRILKHK